MEKKNLFKRSYFSDYFKPSQIVFNLKAKDKVGAIEEILDILIRQKLVTNKKLLLTRIIDRERLESTAIGHNVALPHARVNTGGDLTVGVGKSKKGIDFDAIDNKKVHLIILIIWNPSIPGLFNHLFAGLAQYLSKSGFRNRLFSAKNKSGMYDVLSEIELTLPREDKIINRASLLMKLQKIEIKKRKATKEQKKELKKQADLIRDELDEALVDRFDRLMERYGFAVAEVEDGVCQGCNINMATGMSAAIEGSNDIYICENCGKFLVAAKKKKK
jgi:mannitol/fructose-specific phosphotransferase system IIA component (Ntr-type)